MASTKSSTKTKSESRFSGKFPFRQEKKKKSSSKDKLELEDSGVHFEESTSGALSGVSADSQDDLDPGLDLHDPEHSHTSHSSTTAGSESTGGVAAQMTDNKGLTTPFSRHCAISAPDLGAGATGQRISKSESPQPPSRFSEKKQQPSTEQFPPLAGCGIQKDDKGSASGTGARPRFTLDDSDDSERESSSGSGKIKSVASSTATASPSSTKNKQQTAEHRGREKSSNKGRFKKILKPLRRSHSAGSTKDVPPHALFLRHDLTKERRTPPGRRSVDTGRGSMERQSDDSDSDREPSSSDSKSSSAASSKTKKKTLAQDMKEKFSFFKRRPTDSSISGKDGRPQKPTKDMVLSWTQSFDNLLKDKVGLEWFKDFLGTEFSEENVEFWIACEEYKSVKPNKLNARAQEIFTDFVAVQAPREINLDAKTRMTTKELVEKPDRETFEIAQKRIQALMDKDSYPRFLRSDAFQKLLSEYKIQLNLT